LKTGRGGGRERTGNGGASISVTRTHSQQKKHQIKRDDHDFAALHWAVRFSQNEVVSLLLDNGADVNVANCVNDTPLHIAASEGKLEIVQKVCAPQKTVCVGLTDTRLL